MARKIAGMSVIITGASAGIGKALASELSALGARLVLSARRADKLEALNAQLGGRHIIIPVDVSKQEECERLIAQSIEQLGRIDTLVCNAGYGALKPLADTTRDEIIEMFATNLLGTTDCIHAAVPIMRRQDRIDGWRGQIVIVSSAAARRGLPMFGPYSATKAAQLSIAEAMRVELKEDRIAVTSVHPIGTETDFFTTAENKGVGKLPPRMKGDVTQTPAQVAEAMVRAIERPRPEVWPFRAARFALAFATIAPRIADRIMLRARGKMTVSSK